MTTIQKIAIAYAMVLCNRNAIYTDCANGFILLFLVKIFSNRDRRDKIYQTEMRYG